MSDQLLTAEEKAPLPYRPCAGIMLLNARGEVFVAKRIDTQAEAWQMPQGGVDEGEDVTEAMYRELWEETGVTRDKVSLLEAPEEWLHYDLPEELIGKLWGGKYRGQKQRWFVLRFEGEDADITIETEHPEFSEWKWLSMAQLPEVIVPFKQELYATLAERFAHYSHSI